MRVLFITRKFPPVVGGMERYSQDLYEALSEVTKVDLYANKRGNKVLPLFLVAAALRIAVTGRRYDVIHFGDGLLACLVRFTRFFSAAALTITVHGLDVSYANPVYRAFVMPGLKSADRLIAISRNTFRLCMEAGLDPEAISILPNGVKLTSGRNVIPIRPEQVPADLGAITLLCTVGRLVKRKGHEWFIRNVLPMLGAHYVYVIAGDGPERKHIESAIQELGLTGRAIVLGAVKENEKDWILANSSLFIMSNIKVAGDAEGFGLVLTEAASRGLYSIASRIDGIPDAVIENQTGSLVKTEDADSFAEAIKSANPEKALVRAAADFFSWKRMAGLYLEEMNSAILGKPKPTHIPGVNNAC